MAAAFTAAGGVAVGGRGCSRIGRWWRWDSKLAALQQVGNKAAAAVTVRGGGRRELCCGGCLWRGKKHVARAAGGGHGGARLLVSCEP